jgi:uncharacterized protein YgiM (DUF1202 family)
MARTLSVILLGMLLLARTTAVAAPGDTLYVHGNHVNVRSAPSRNAKVLQQVHYGYVVIEIQRRHQWVNVSLAHAAIKTGWIHASLLRAVPQHQ